MIVDIRSLLMGLKEHWVEFTQKTILNGWYFIGALFSLKKYFQQRVMNQISPTAMLVYHLVSSVGSSNSHPDLLLTHQQHPLFQTTPVLNPGLKLSEPLQLYKGYNAIKRKNLARLWHTLEFSGIPGVLLWHTLAYSSILWHTLAYTDILWHTLAYS